MKLSNHQRPVEEDEGSARQQQIHGMGNKLKYEGTCKKPYDLCLRIYIFTLTCKLRICANFPFLI